MSWSITRLRLTTSVPITLSCKTQLVALTVLIYECWEKYIQAKEKKEIPMFTNVLTLTDCTFPPQTNYDGCYHNIWMLAVPVISLCYGMKISNQYSHLKTTDWSHVFNITHFPCNCILFTKFNTKLLHKHNIITLFHYQLILWHVQPHLLAKKSGQNMSENRMIMKKCFCSKLVLKFCKSHVM